jgi:ABC-type nickel/cobalt efflux system permease component RcnA
MRRSYLLALSLILSTFAAPAMAHPVPSESHHRVFLVRLTPEAISVSYRVEVDPKWATWELTRIDDLKDELGKIKEEPQLYALYQRYHAKPIAYNLVARLDGQPLTFRVVRGRELLTDSLRCEYLFEAPCKLTPGHSHTLTLVDVNYDRDKGELRSAVSADLGVTLRGAKWLNGADDRARELTTTFELAEPRAADKPALPPDPAPQRTAPRRVVSRGKGAVARAESVARTAPAPETRPALTKDVPPQEIGAGSSPAKTEHDDDSNSLLALLFDRSQGIGMLLLLAALFGAGHALTPGHGKAMVAAYLVGERGTTWHAVVLGLVTTLAHTSTVLLLAVLLTFLFPGASHGGIKVVLGLVGGLLIAGIGFWLLLCRLSGRADHVHLGGSHHHHHHGDGHHHDHDHGVPHRHDPVTGEPIVERAGWWRVIGLGIAGGVVPCWDALLLLCVAVSAGRIALAVPLLLAFSAGLASVLVALGLIVVHSKNLAGARWGKRPFVKRLFGALPILSAVIVTALGLWLCYDSIHH